MARGRQGNALQPMQPHVRMHCSVLVAGGLRGVACYAGDRASHLAQRARLSSVVDLAEHWLPCTCRDYFDGAAYHSAASTASNSNH
jgi:hypothetical protein